MLKILAFLRARGVVPPLAPVARSEWFQDFDGYLDRVAGLSAGTRRIYGRYATRFVARRFGGEAPDWPRITASDLVDFVLRETSSLKPSGCRAPVTATRAFLRFLAVRGLVREGLEAAIPPVREWKHARLPRHLTVDQVAAVLDSCSETTTVGRRDRAILALLARLGLRAGEVVGLDLEDIDWAHSQLRVRASKSGKERVLPLPHDVGVAIVAYLRTERPAAIQRAVFLRATPPHRRLGNSSTVSAVAKRHLRLAGIPAGAAHALRHTAATLMVRRGVTFKEVADILGHARLETTAIYAKLDLEALARVALSWPGGAP